MGDASDFLVVTGDDGPKTKNRFIASCGGESENAPLANGNEFDRADQGTAEK